MECCSVCKFDKCVCQSFWKDFERLLTETVYFKEDYEASPLFISTITLNFNIDANVDLDMFMEICKNIQSIKEVGFPKGGRKKKEDTDNANKSFYNQC